MNQEEVLDLFTDHGALLKGHFRLSSGLHSDTYLQCAKVLAHPTVAAKLGQAIGSQFAGKITKTDLVISPALGGVIIGHEVARAMGLPHVFTERQNGEMTLRRGFEIPEGTNFVLIEDVVTTGKSSREVLKLIRDLGGIPVGAGSIINRSGKENPFEEEGIPYVSLAVVDAKAWPEDQLPPHLKDLPVTAPGSRYIKK